MRIAALAIVLLGVLPGAASAQPAGPLPIVVVDVRGFYTGLGQDPLTAEGLVVLPSALPKRGLGGVVGLHFYPWRGRNVSLGIGGEGVLVRARAQEEGEAGLPRPDPIHQKMQGLAGVVSLNFGQRDGWSYISAGMGPLSLATYQGDAAPAESAPVQMTINLGAGARWFAWRHVAFTFDIRFYQTRPEVATAFYPGRQRSQLRVLSAGISLR
jgi:hypothetical protein